MAIQLKGFVILWMTVFIIGASSEQESDQDNSIMMDNNLYSNFYNTNDNDTANITQDSTQGFSESTINGTAYCPDNWILSPSVRKCYFFSPQFVSSSFFETSAFCQALGGQLVEPMNMEDFEEVQKITESLNGVWSWGPWVALVRPFGDGKVIGLSSGSAPGDAQLATLLNDIVVNMNSTGLENCAGYAPGGIDFKFWDCSLWGNPFCEMPATFIELYNSTETNSTTTNK